jgi:16S rRNA (guanine527-N7)-methyltransferase
VVPFQEQLAQLAIDAGITLSEKELARLKDYYTLLEHWNQKINLTALPLAGHPLATLRRLLLEPIMASRFVPNRSLAWIDVGSGGGSPAIPLKILRPAARLTLVESRERKAAFLGEAIRTLDLRDTGVLTTRFEDLTIANTAHVDLVSSRAVKVDAAFWASCQRITGTDGQLLLFVRAMWQSGEIASAEGFRLVDTLEIPGSEATVLSFARMFHVEQR